jgi:hypothetical protein
VAAKVVLQLKQLQFTRDLKLILQYPVFACPMEERSLMIFQQSQMELKEAFLIPGILEIRMIERLQLKKARCTDTLR